MIKENKIKKCVVVIICLLGMLILSGKTENVFANDKKQMIWKIFYCIPI